MNARPGAVSLSAECALAQQPGYEDLHAQCSQIRDVPLPHSSGIVLVPRCRCTCHVRAEAAA